jgi:hypothetical protein
VILYFAPGLGLMDLLGHVTMGQIEATKDILIYDTNKTFSGKRVM